VTTDFPLLHNVQTGRPTQLPIPWTPGVLTTEVKWPGCDVDHSPTSSKH
jgi:hypothetical protein